MALRASEGSVGLQGWARALQPKLLRTRQTLHVVVFLHMSCSSWVGSLAASGHIFMWAGKASPSLHSPLALGSKPCSYVSIVGRSSHALFGKFTIITSIERSHALLRIFGRTVCHLEGISQCAL